LRMARQNGISIITGIEMFVQQGARQFEIFTGKPAPEEEMLRVVIHSLRQQAEAVAETPVAAEKAPASNGKKAPAAKAKKAS
jgi:3-dehydroquinate dehydratase / shikimate dehydrogenase